MPCAVRRSQGSSHGIGEREHEMAPFENESIKGTKTKLDVCLEKGSGLVAIF